MRREVRWERMFPDELEAAKSACPLVYLTYGLCEPHGPQNALGMDALRPHGVACRAAWESGGVVAPPHYWHIHDYGIYSAWAQPLIGEACPWSTPLPPWMFFKNLFYHVRAVDALGFRAVAMYTGHLGPHGRDMQPIVDILQPHVAARLGFYGDFHLMPEEFKKGFSHGGNVETSYLWAVAPDCVDLSRLPAPGSPGPHFAMGADAGEAKRCRGEAVVAALAANLAGKGRELLAEYERLRPPQAPLTFDQVEEIWETEVRPRFHTFASMQDLAPNQKAPPETSRWYRNWRVPKRS